MRYPSEPVPWDKYRWWNAASVASAVPCAILLKFHSGWWAWAFIPILLVYIWSFIGDKSED